MIPCATTLAQNIAVLIYGVLPNFAQHLITWDQYRDFVVRCLH